MNIIFIIIAPVIGLELPEGDVSHNDVKLAVAEFRILKALVLYFRGRVEQLCYTRSKAVKLHSEKPAVIRHLPRHISEKVSRTH